MSQVYNKEKYEFHPVIEPDQHIRILTVNKSRFTLCDIVKTTQDLKQLKNSEKICDENYLKALKLHNNPRTQSAAPAARDKDSDEEYSNDFESEISEKPQKLSLDELKKLKRDLQLQRKRIEQGKKEKAEKQKKIVEEKKLEDEQVAREEFFRWHEEKKKKLAEEKKKKMLQEWKQKESKEKKNQEKIEKKFREMEERQKRLSKLKNVPAEDKPEKGYNKDFPTILAYSTSRKIKSHIYL